MKNGGKAAWWLVMLALVPAFPGCEDELPFPNRQGVGGSLHRLFIHHNFLYGIDNRYLNIYDLSNPGHPVFIRDWALGFNIDNYALDDSLLVVVSRGGLQLESLLNPVQPDQLSTYEDVSSCESVVINDEFVYTMTRFEENCDWKWDGQITIINIEERDEPLQEAIEYVNTPFGMAIDSHLLFVCGGDSGLTVYDVSDPRVFNILDQVNHINAREVYLHDSLALIHGPDAIYQLSYADPSNLLLLSTLDLEE